jgi:hypothetical protein
VPTTEEASEIQLNEARRVISSLRLGLPPEGYVRYFTVGREGEISQLKGRLDSSRIKATLLKANYGSGKTHLLRYIKEMALQEKFAVSVISLDAKSGISFNRIDQIFCEVLKNIQFQEGTIKGTHALFQTFFTTKIGPDIQQQNSSGTLNLYINQLNRMIKCYPLFIGLSAWIKANLNPTQNPLLHMQLEAWLENAWNPTYSRSWIENNVISTLKDTIDIKRVTKDNSDAFSLKANSYLMAWHGLDDLDKLIRAAGYRGLVLLVDEFEDVIYNISRADFKIQALQNLFRFFRLEYSHPSFFAVTPGFINKCTNISSRRGYSPFGNANSFTHLPTFEMGPIKPEELEKLALKIIEMHDKARSIL